MKWYAVSPDGKAFELVLDRNLDQPPRCYTFLKPIDGKPIRLAVGHYWGVSLFEMNPRGKWTEGNKFHRSRVYVGHQGYVTSVAPSDDHKLLVTAGRDMTANCWPLTDWPNQAELGVDFTITGGQLVVNKTAAGSPAWQAGLEAGSVVKLLETENGPEVKGGPQEWQKRFAAAKPFQEFIFTYQNRGEKAPSKTLMTARQRPVWRFFPTFAEAPGGQTAPQDWVLWRWQDYYYDASTNGDRYVGWQISGNAADQPVYHAAERLRGRFLNPGKVRNTLDQAAANPEHVLFREIEPPKVSIKLVAPPVKDGDVKVTVSAEQVGVGELQALQRVEIWVNDRFLARTLTAADFNNGDLPPTQVTVRSADLQSGANSIKAIAVNKASGHDEDTVRFNYETSPRPRPVLHGLMIGIHDYSKSAPRLAGMRNPIDLSGAKDAEVVGNLWRAQKSGQLYAAVQMKELLDAAATPAAILKELDRLSTVVKPDDQLVLFLAGHGDADEDKVKGEYRPGTFRFAGPNYDPKRLAATTLSSEDLYKALYRLNCHQLVLLDACHSGDVASNPLQDLRRNGVGALILAACKNSQESMEDPVKQHGFFMLALEEAVGQAFKADRKGSGVVEATDLAEYVMTRVPPMVKKFGAEYEQTPEVSPWAHDLLSYRRKLAMKP
jgi:hypothetical protein